MDTKLKRIMKLIRNKCEIYAKLTKNKLFNSELCGMCAIASDALHTAFNMENYESELVVGNYFYKGKAYLHCWVEINYIIYDITATQFDRKKIIIEQSMLPYIRHYIVIDIDEWNKWREWQRPSKNIRNYLLRDYFNL